MTVYLPSWNSHCAWARFAVLASCSGELAVRSFACRSRLLAKVTRGLFNCWSCSRQHDHTSVGRVGLRGGNGGNCPGPSAPRGPPWWHLFVLNKVFVWKIVVIQKRRKNTNSIFRCCLSWFLWKFDFLPVLVVTTEYKYFSILFNANIFEFCL